MFDRKDFSGYTGLQGSCAAVVARLRLGEYFSLFLPGVGKTTLLLSASFCRIFIAIKGTLTSI
jgi:hypothetical protein